MTFVGPSDQKSSTCFVGHGSNSPISFMTHWKVLFCLYPICSLGPINSIPPSARASYEISNILVQSNHQTVTDPKMRTYARNAMAKRRMCELSVVARLGEWFRRLLQCFPSPLTEWFICVLWHSEVICREDEGYSRVLSIIDIGISLSFSWIVLQHLLRCGSFPVAVRCNRRLRSYVVKFINLTIL